MFEPTWLLNKEYAGVLSEIYKFTQKYGTPPSLDTLDTVYKDQDETQWELKYKPIIEEIRQTQPDLPSQLYVLDKAREVAICRSFENLTSSIDFQELKVDLSGEKILKRINEWMFNFLKTSDEVSMDIKEAVDDLVQSVGFNDRTRRVGTNIPPVDNWTRGGLRPTQLGIFLAPTGHGKSAVLMNIAYNIAAFETLPVWFITNELSIAEQTERFLSRMTNKPLDKIQDDPILAYDGLGKHWDAGLNDRLRLTSVNRKVSAQDIEAMMIRWSQISGWKPAVIVLDFMERMKPVEAMGVTRSQEWVWLGAIAEDLKNLAKKHDIILWTAGQTNRKAYDDEVNLKLDMAQSSIRHLQESDATIGMRKVEDVSGNDAMEFFSLKMRHSKLEHLSKVYKVNLETMYITQQETEKKGKKKKEAGDDSVQDGPALPTVKKTGVKK